MKITKEQLQIELTKIRQSHEGWVSGDERRRKEFAKAFNWVRRGMYGVSVEEPLLPSWEEIFVKVGRLLATDDVSKLQRSMDGNFERLNNLEQEVFSKREKTN